MKRIIEIEWTQRAGGHYAGDVEEVEMTPYVEALIKQGRVVVRAETEVATKEEDVDQEQLAKLIEETGAVFVPVAIEDVPADVIAALDAKSAEADVMAEAIYPEEIIADLTQNRKRSAK